MDAISDVSRASQIFSAIPTRGPLPQPIDVDDLLGFSEAIRRRDFRKGLLDDAGDQLGFGRNKIFINHVDSYIGKYLVSVLSQKRSEDNLVVDSTFSAAEAVKSPKEEESGLVNESLKSPTTKDRSPPRSKTKSPKKATSKKEKSPTKSKASKKGKPGKETESPRNVEKSFEDFEDIVEEETFPYDTSKLTVPEYYDLMELEPGEMRTKYLEEKLGKYLPKLSSEIKAIPSADTSVKSKRKRVIPTGNLEIIGTLAKEGNQNVVDGVKEIIKVSEYDEDFVKTLAGCAAVVYVINEDFDQIHEATWVLIGLVNYLEDIKISEDPSEHHLPVFILVSTYMTWALTKPFDPNRPDLPFIEKDHRKRKPHPNFQYHYELEEQLIHLKSNGCIDSLIVTCGIPYGHEESTLRYLFEMAFNCHDLPVFEPGSNYVPLVHVEHIGLIIKQVLKMGVGDSSFVFAIDPVSYNTMREIVEAVSCGFGSGCIRTISNLSSFLRDEITQDIYDEVNTNIVLDSSYSLYKEEDVNWKYASGFVANIKDIVEEYINANNIIPLRVAFYYSQIEFEEIVKKLSDIYNVPIVTPRSVICEYVNEALEQIKSLEETEEGQSLEVDERDAAVKDNRECKDDSLVAVNLIKHLNIKLTKDVHKLSETLRMSILREVLKTRRYLNRGFILDNFPQTSEGCKSLFYFNEDNSSKVVPSVETIPLPNYVISFTKGEERIVSKDSEMSHILSINESVQELDDANDEEKPSLVESDQRVDLMENPKIKIKSFKKLPTKVVEFFLENNNKCKLIEKDIKGSYNAKTVLRELLKSINASFEEEPRDSKSSSHQEMDQSSLPEHYRSLAEEQKKSDSIEEIASSIESMKKKDHDSLKEEEERILAVRSVPYIKYLINYIFPTLTNAILEVCDNRPEDPLDFIAEYLFKNNPDGRMLDPSEEIRKQELLEKSKGVVKIDSKACLV